MQQPKNMLLAAVKVLLLFLCILMLLNIHRAAGIPFSHCAKQRSIDLSKLLRMTLTIHSLMSFPRSCGPSKYVNNNVG